MLKFVEGMEPTMSGGAVGVCALYAYREQMMQHPLQGKQTATTAVLSLSAARLILRRNFANHKNNRLTIDAARKNQHVPYIVLLLHIRYICTYTYRKPAFPSLTPSAARPWPGRYTIQ